MGGGERFIESTGGLARPAGVALRDPAALRDWLG